jgi:hypothetical protein
VGTSWTISATRSHEPRFLSGATLLLEKAVFSAACVVPPCALLRLFLLESRMTDSASGRAASGFSWGLFWPKIYLGLGFSLGKDIEVFLAEAQATIEVTQEAKRIRDREVRRTGNWPLVC